LSLPSSFFCVKGKAFLVTGASSEVGTHLAYFLASEGANVVMAARRPRKLQPVLDAIEKLNAGKVAMKTVDVTRGKEAVEEAISECWSEFGRIDVLINNAGVFDLDIWTQSMRPRTISCSRSTPTAAGWWGELLPGKWRQI